jgi:hypothetical protein
MGRMTGRARLRRTFSRAPDFYQCTRSATLTTSKFRTKPKLPALAVCGNIVFEAANLSNVCLNSIQPGRRALTLVWYDHIHETHGCKNIVLANRISMNNNPDLPCDWITPSELKAFKRITHIVRFITTAIHELLGYVSGKLLSKTSPGAFNFDAQNPPTNPLTGKPVTSYYIPNQTWTSVFLESWQEQWKSVGLSSCPSISWY